MKKDFEGVVFCCECLPFKIFFPPSAAAQAKAHYDTGKHDITDRVSGIEVQA